MNVLAHFYVRSVKEIVGQQFEVEMEASTKGPNDWSRYTPAAHIKLLTVNAEAAEQFRKFIGRDMQVAFSEIPEQPAAAGAS